MTTPFIRIDGRGQGSYFRFNPPKGGNVWLEPSEQYLTVGPLDCLPSAAPFGALSISVPKGENVVLDAFEYRFEDEAILSDDGWFSFLSASLIAGAASTEEDIDMSRRKLLACTGAALGGGVLAMSDVAAGAQSRTVSIAELSVEVNTSGFSISLTDDVASVLPADQEYKVLVDSVEVGSFGPSQTAVTIGADVTGEISILTEANMSTWQRIKSDWFADDEQSMTLELPVQASSVEEDESVMISSDSSAVSPVVEAGADDTIVEVGGESIPHESESGNEEAGHYEIRDESKLIYVAGTDPPDATAVSVRTGIGTTDELYDDATRRIS